MLAAWTTTRQEADAFAVVMLPVAALILAAMALAWRQRRPFLWRRALALVVGVYCCGALVGAWSWAQARPAFDSLTHWFGG